MVIKKSTLVKTGIGAAAAVTIAAVALPVAGFTAAGVAAGSAAAAWQSTIGSVAAGSLFASLQSAGVLGFAASTNLGIAAGGAVAANGDTIIKTLIKKFKNSEKSSSENSEFHFDADSDQSNEYSGFADLVLDKKRSDKLIIDKENIKDGWDFEDEDIELPAELEYSSAASQDKYFIVESRDAPTTQVRLNNSKFLDDQSSKSKVSSITCKLNTFNEKIQDCQQLTTSGKFQEAIERFRVLLLSIPLAAGIYKLEKAEARQLSEMCREYILGLSLELERKSLPKETLEQQKRNCEMAAYFTHCNLDPVHQILALRLAINLSFKLKNYKTAGSFARRLLELGPNEEVEQRTRMILQACEKNPVDEHSLVYNEDKPFSICGHSYKPIYEEDLKLKCSFCQTSYFLEFYGRICKVCGKLKLERILMNFKNEYSAFPI